MKYINRLTSRTSQSPQWRMTDDGFLRCTARVQQEKVLQYTLDEFETRPEGFTKEAVNVYLPGEALADAEALKSLEGMPVVAWDHTWMDPSSTKDMTVGSVSGTPKIEGEFLVCDLLITDAVTIAQIKNGEIGEISAAYYADTIFKEGIFNGEMFDAKQEVLRYNHIAVIPVGEGRAGIDVRITNKLNKSEEQTMGDTIKLVRVQARNTKKYMNMDEESADVYAEETSATDDKETKATENMAEMQGEMDTYKQNMGETEQLLARIQELEGELAVYKQQAEVMPSNDQQIEEAALNMVAETGEAREILEGSELVTNEGCPMDEKQSKEFMNSIPSIHGDALRKTVLTAVGIKVENMSPEALKGAWSARKQITNMKPPKVAGHKMFHQQMKDTATRTPRTARDRLGIE